mmetsp:Transcript_12737/g.39237  ORF Transcript_12737/g.39237 Transcript_12737/m.39237 type:complete len:220 (+) Transcript_12737:189-848(+)
MDEKPPGGARTRLELRLPRELPTFWPPLPFAPPYELPPWRGPALPSPRAWFTRAAYDWCLSVVAKGAAAQRAGGGAGFAGERRSDVDGCWTMRLPDVTGGAGASPPVKKAARPPRVADAPALRCAFCAAIFCGVGQRSVSRIGAAAGAARRSATSWSANGLDARSECCRDMRLPGLAAGWSVRPPPAIHDVVDGGAFSLKPRSARRAAARWRFSSSCFA